MNLFFTTYGIKKEVEEMKEALSSIAFPVKAKDAMGVETQGFVQGILQPVQLWKFSFPENQLDVVCRTLQFNNLSKHHSNLNKYYALMRKVLRLKKIPNIEPIGAFYPLIRQRFPDVNLTAIGYSEDLKQPNGNENL